MTIQVGCWSDIGSREINQDAVLSLYADISGGSLALCAVCDGVGGLDHGEIASSAIKGRMQEWFDGLASWYNAETIEPGLILSHLKDAAEEWNSEVRDIIVGQGIRTGSTMSVLVLAGKEYYLLHVGDSRIYHWNGSLERLTQDDSVARMKGGKAKNYLANFMGKQESLCFKAADGMLRGGELFLVCSDGGYHHLKEQDVLDAYKNLEQGENVDDVCAWLVRSMIERGERDNTSVALAYVAAENALAESDDSDDSADNDETVIE